MLWALMSLMSTKGLKKMAPARGEVHVATLSGSPDLQCAGSGEKLGGACLSTSWMAAQ